jgi:hypothetical protein
VCWDVAENLIRGSGFHRRLPGVRASGVECGSSQPRKRLYPIQRVPGAAWRIPQRGCRTSSALNGTAEIGNLLTLRASAPQRAPTAGTETRTVLFNESASLSKLGKLGIAQRGLSERILTEASRGRPKINVKGGSPGAQTICQGGFGRHGRVAGRILPNDARDKFHND